MGYLGRRIGLSQNKGNSTPDGGGGAVVNGFGIDDSKEKIPKFSILSYTNSDQPPQAATY